MHISRTHAIGWRVQAGFLVLGLAALLLRANAAVAGVEANTDASGVVLHGYDPVAYFTDGKPVRGNEQFTADFAGGRYRFSTAAHRDAFLANPAKYAPQYGGYCAYGVSEGKKFDVDPAAYKIVDGKLYLNINPQILEKWSHDAAGYIRKSDETWPRIRDKAAGEL